MKTKDLNNIFSCKLRETPQNSFFVVRGGGVINVDIEEEKSILFVLGTTPEVDAQLINK